MSDPLDKQYRQFFMNSLCAELQNALNQSTGAQWNVSESDKPGAGLAATPPTLYKLVLKGEIAGGCYLQMAAEEAKAVAAQISQKTPSAATGDPLLGMLENATTEFMLALVNEYGEVEVGIEKAAELPSVVMEVVPLRASSGGTLLSIVLYMEPALVQSMEKKIQPAVQQPGPEVPSQMESISRTTGVDEAKLKLILDVELNLLLRFGQRHLTLREILDLNSGSVIELDRQVDEPIELLLDGRVIARGEAVVVDGNYGLRVTDVPQPMASQLTH